MFSLDEMKKEILAEIVKVNANTAVTVNDITVNFTRNVFEVTIENLDTKACEFFIGGSAVIGRYVVRTILYLVPTEDGFVTVFRG